MLLAPYRVLDLTDARVPIAGQILARLGAEVIAIEPPGGVAIRGTAPFVGDHPDGEKSLFHLAWNRGKRSVVIDANVAGDLELLRSLVAGADVLIDEGPRSIASRFGLDEGMLAALNPALVHVSVTPFGLDGPKSDWEGSDLVVWASGGPLALTGDHDRPPVPVGVGQAYVHAGAEAAGAALVALLERGRSGLGQRVDVSAQQCVAAATQAIILATPNRASGLERAAGGLRAGPITIRRHWECRDGLVLIMFHFGSGLGAFTRRLMEWVHDEGFCDEATRDKDWVAYGAMLTDGSEPVSEYERVEGILERFCLSKTKRELLDGAIQRSLLIAPILEMGDVVEWPQLDARGWWELVDGRRYPGGFGRPSTTHLPLLGSAPLLGADTEEVRREPARTPAVRSSVDRSDPRKAPLAGLRVLDLSWVIAGPSSTRVLADYGATVVRVESSRRIETGRTIIPFCDDEPGTDRSALYGTVNCGKLGITVDLTSEGGRSVILDLVRWADVVTESFSPKAMKAWGLDYQVLREVNPSIVMLSSSLFGSDGPMATLAGFGSMASALSGFFSVTGWPDRAPCGPFGAYSDYIAPRYATALLLAALDHRHRTGEGQYFDFSQTEAAMQGLTPAILRRVLDGRDWERIGAGDRHAHPHGVHLCADGQWVALSCESDLQRDSLRSLAGGLDESSIAGWTSVRSADAAMRELQAVGVAAHWVQNSAECFGDPQLHHRGHFVAMAHPVAGTMTVEGPRAHLLSTPAIVRRPPTLGEHTFEVLTEILGYDTDRIGELLANGSLE